jgi:2-(1,2-epoxy-1,2-dihydrophenyl)acetyl-CoA isomerase
VELTKQKGGITKMEFTTLLFEVRDHVAHVTLNRPEAANSVNEEMAKDLMHAALRCDEDPEIRAVLISGAGKIFSGGGDLKAFSAKGNQLPSYLKEVATYFHAAISRLTRMDAPTIVAVHGAVAGAGMSIAVACDFVIASETTQFIVAYTRVGLTPDGSLTYFLPRIIGLKRALELTLTNRMFSAQEALQWGLITQIVPDNELLSQARTIAVQLAAGPTRAYGGTKRLLHSGWAETLETQMEHESREIARSAHTADAHEGITALLEKRPPKYRGK